jgi:hypothetical protein
MAPPEINPGFNMSEELNSIKDAKGKYNYPVLNYRARKEFDIGISLTRKF